MLDSYIISTQMNIGGKFEPGFFEGLMPCSNRQVMNVFTVQHTSDRKKAKIFYDQEEADKMAAFISKKGLIIATVEPTVKSKSSEPAKPAKEVNLEKVETALRNALGLINSERESVCDEETGQQYDAVIAESEDALKEFE